MEKEEPLVSAILQKIRPDIRSRTYVNTITVYVHVRCEEERGHSAEIQPVSVDVHFLARAFIRGIASKHIRPLGHSGLNDRDVNGGRSLEGGSTFVEAAGDSGVRRRSQNEGECVKEAEEKGSGERHPIL